MYNNTFDVSCRRVHVSMATKALQGDTYLYETSSAKRDFFLRNLVFKLTWSLRMAPMTPPTQKKKKKKRKTKTKN